MIKSIVFDKDGTLLEFGRFWLPVTEATVKRLLHAHGYTEELLPAMLAAVGAHDGIAGLLCHGTYATITAAFNSVLEAQQVPTALTVDEVGNAFVASLGCGELVPTCENLRGILEALRARGLILAVVTSDNAASTTSCLRALGIDDLFDCLLTDDGIHPAKPDPHHMRVFCERFGLLPSEVLMVGDTLTDMAFAENSGAHAIGIAKTEADARILAPHAEHILRDVSHIWELPHLQKPVKTVLFDLDGTLLPMDQAIFTKAYFKELTSRAAADGYDPKALGAAIMTGIGAMIRNDGAQSNEAAFWQCFAQAYGEPTPECLAMFDDFYAHFFENVRRSCGFQPKAAALIHELQAHDVRLVLATNPIFPRVATESRIRWAGLSPADFEWITTYENASHCKPNPAYYRDILQALDLSPEDCLMVGNDAEEDTVAATLGMKVFLITDCLINTKETDITPFPHGDFEAAMSYISAITGA